MADPVMWMVRGDSGNLYEDFRDRSALAIGWRELLSAAPGMSRDQLGDIYARERPDLKRGTIVSGAAQVWRFLNEMKSGDWTITYNPSTRKYLVGTIEGRPEAHPELANEGMSWMRAASWKSEIDRDALSSKSKRALGPTLTVFQVDPQASTEIRAVAAGATALESKPTQAEVIEIEASGDKTLFDDLEGQSIEFIKDEVTKLDWEAMQELVAGILRGMRYKTRVSPPGPDGGTDIFASPDGLGFENPRIVVEVKHRRDTASAQMVRAFITARRHKDDRCLFVSTGGFTKEARYEAQRADVPVMLWELDDIVRSIVGNYEALDADTKQLIPLRRLYWPASKLMRA